MPQKRKLNKTDIMWIVSIKRDLVSEFYMEHYMNEEPSVDTLFHIVSEIIDKLDLWKNVVNHSLEAPKSPNLKHSLWQGIIITIKRLSIIRIMSQTDESWDDIIEKEDFFVENL